MNRFIEKAEFTFRAKVLLLYYFSVFGNTTGIHVLTAMV